MPNMTDNIKERRRAAGTCTECLSDDLPRGQRALDELADRRNRPPGRVTGPDGNEAYLRVFAEVVDGAGAGHLHRRAAATGRQSRSGPVWHVTISPN